MTCGQPTSAALLGARRGWARDTCEALDGIGGLVQKMAGDGRVPGGKDGASTFDAYLHDICRSLPWGTPEAVKHFETGVVQTFCISAS